MMNSPATDPDIDSPAEQIIVYWRPGCPFCMNLERNLEKLDVPFVKNNIWEDPEHAAYVRSVANGNEVVPTVRIGSVALVNPSASEVLAVASRELPGLGLPEAKSDGGPFKRLRRR